MMKVKSRNDACRILGVDVFASDEDIKNAYRTLCKQYHPDVVDDELSWQYYDIQEAYEFLQNNPMSIPSDKILGASSDLTQRYSASKEAGAAINRARKDERQRKEKRLKELEETAQRIQYEREESERHRRQITEEAMEHIRAIQMADVISKMLDK